VAAEFVSFGAGVNSVAMVIVLAQEGWRGPLVFADTGGERPDTYCYIRYFEDNYLKPNGMTVTWLHPGSEYHGPDAQVSLEEFCLRKGIIPLLAIRWCSAKWKIEPCSKWAEAHGMTVRLIGFSADEPLRVRDGPGVRYPLIEAHVTRNECMRIIQREGLLVPRKSGCFFCGGQPYAQWRRLYYEYPELYERAMAMEDNARQHGRQATTLDPKGISLREHRERRWAGQLEMDLSQWLPCVCSL